MRVRRRRDRTRASPARDGGEQDALTHAVAVGARLGAEERNAQVRRAARGDGYGDRGAVGPVRVLDGVAGAAGGPSGDRAG